jgi:hypothetical protein
MSFHHGSTSESVGSSSRSPSISSSTDDNWSFFQTMFVFAMIGLVLYGNFKFFQLLFFS